MGELDDSFAKLLGRQPSDAERQQLYKVRDALGLKNNDALWLVLMALQHYQDQYERFPNAIALAAKETLANFKATADTMIIASVEAAKADLAQAVAETVHEVAHHTAQKTDVAVGGRLFGGGFSGLWSVRLVFAQQSLRCWI